MRKLNKEELDNMHSRGTRNASKFYKTIINLNVGEGLFISKKEYNLVQNPGKICRRIMKKYSGIKYIIMEETDESGWKVERKE